MQLSASSAALDLALSQSPAPGSQSTGWLPFARHRPSQQSLPQNVFDPQRSDSQTITTPTSSSLQSFDATVESSGSSQLNRRSMEATSSYTHKSVFNQTPANSSSNVRPTLANLQLSYSTNDIPTLKNANSVTSPISPAKTQAQQQFHNHNASLGRIPAHAISNRLSISNVENRQVSTNGYKPQQSELHASAAPFGPSTLVASPVESNGNMMSSPQFANQAYYGGYGMQLMNMGMTPMQMGNGMNYNPMALYQQQTQYPAYSHYGQVARFPDSQARIIQQRRLQNAEGTRSRPSML